MGCDGGTIPKRHELVKGPKKVEKVDKDAELVAQWNYCTLSQEILRRPIVACELGRLYNKDAVIEFLLDKSSEKALGKATSHIKSIKNVTELRLSDNPAWEGDKGNTKGDKHDDLQRARFICPVVGLEMNGRHRFCFLRCCGCVFSERALKEIKAEVCHTCGAAFQEDDVIVLNGTKEDVETLKGRMEERRQKAKLGKNPQGHQKLRQGSPKKPASILERRKPAQLPKVQQTGALREKSGSLCAEPQRGPSPTVKNLKLTSPSSLRTAPPSAPRRSRPTGSPTRPTASEARTAPGAPQALLGLRGGGAVPCALSALGVCAVGKSPSQTSEPAWSPLLARGAGSPGGRAGTCPPPPAGPVPASPCRCACPPSTQKDAWAALSMLKIIKDSRFLMGVCVAHFDQNSHAFAANS
ncbi:replication termination factor 2 isoform X3 [Lynx canadensis]|uniref:replication termination factor 2 isoform X3 n=1 Tax=Lynx canadensis TaxID=61383 RepID=UPI0011B046FF|nr:replication termination factor 2 isoform X3 [Lynx canadensis]